MGNVVCVDIKPGSFCKFWRSRLILRKIFGITCFIAWIFLNDQVKIFIWYIWIMVFHHFSWVCMFLAVRKQFPDLKPNVHGFLVPLKSTIFEQFMHFINFKFEYFCFNFIFYIGFGQEIELGGLKVYVFKNKGESPSVPVSELFVKQILHIWMKIAVCSISQRKRLYQPRKRNQPIIRPLLRQPYRYILTLESLLNVIWNISGILIHEIDWTCLLLIFLKFLP